MGRSKSKRDDPTLVPQKGRRRKKSILFLEEKHGNKFDTPWLRLWACMLANDIHYDLKPSKCTSVLLYT
jgi:hypothetical protein